MTVSVVQLGARMHYAVPRILQSAGMLTWFFTDAYAGSAVVRPLSVLPPAIQPTGLRSLLARNLPGVPSAKVCSYPFVSLRYHRRLSKAKPFTAEEAQAHLAAGSDLAKRVIKHGLGNSKSVYAFNSASYDLFRFAKARGMTTVYEQTIAPVETEWKLLREEHAEWSGWENHADLDSFYAPFRDVEQQEWTLADCIVCGSRFVRDEVLRISKHRNVHVVPYGVDGRINARHERERWNRRRLRVLTVGAAGLRKGAPYVAQVATRLKKDAEFRWVGASNLDTFGLDHLRQHVEVVGPVPRSEMTQQYQWADVFFLPSICEGSATVTYEAIQNGLPLVVTPNTGAPLPSDYPGLVAIRDVDAMTNALVRLVADPDHWDQQSQWSRRLAPDLDVPSYGARLLSAVS